MRITVIALLFATFVQAADPEIRLEVPSDPMWTGQNIPVAIELRAPGSFSGAPAFDIPNLPNSLLIKEGTPGLSNETKGDTEFFVQRHDFMLVSQAEGELEIPPITVRFSHKKGYTGDDFDAELKNEPATVTLKRPPGMEEAGFIVTCDKIEISESWEPQPGEMKVGDALKRTVTQQVTRMSGIALQPFPQDVPDGIRIYVDEPAVSDKVERGQFDGNRVDTVTYLIQQPGNYTLPEITYQWWNPTSKKIESHVLPEVAFTATAPPPPPEPPSPWRYLWMALVVAFLVAVFLLRRRIAALCSRVRDFVDPPSQRVGRAFLKACKQNDAHEAIKKWSVWIQMQSGWKPPSELSEQVSILERHLFGPSPEPDNWDGSPLAKAFRHRSDGQSVATESNALPPLNA